MSSTFHQINSQHRCLLQDLGLLNLLSKLLASATSCRPSFTRHPSIAVEWDYEKHDTTPQDFAFGSTRVV